MSSLRIADIRFTSSTGSEVERGMLGYVSFLLDGRIYLDGVTVHRTRDGELTLSFPAKLGRRGREWPYVRPIDNETRRAIEAQVFAALGLTSEGSR